jgi:hypothetical protein
MLFGWLGLNDRDIGNNRWLNLFLLFNVDHRKLHNGERLMKETRQIVEAEEEVPF